MTVSMTDAAVYSPADLLTSAEVSGVQALVSGGGKLTGKFVLAGDSLTDICGGLRSDGSRSAIFANSWWWWANTAVGSPLGPDDWINAGVTGNTAQQLLDRWSTDVAAFQPKGIHLLIGTNDCSAAASGTVDTVVAAAKVTIQELITRAKALTSLVIVGTLPGRGQAFAATSYQLEATGKLNAWLRSIAVSQGFELADYASAITDPATAGAPIYDAANPTASATAITNDGLHFNGAGSCLVGGVLAPILRTVLKSQRQPTLLTASPQLLPNPSLAGASGSSAPTSWYVQSPTGGAISHSYEARTDGVFGNWLVNTCPADTRHLYKLFTQIAPPVTTAGTKYRALVEFSFEYLATDADSHIGLALTYQNGSFADIGRDEVNQPSNWASLASTFVKQSALIGSGVIECIGTVVSNTVYLSVTLTYGAKAKVKVGSVTLTKLPA